MSPLDVPAPPAWRAAVPLLEAAIVTAAGLSFPVRRLAEDQTVEVVHDALGRTACRIGAFEHAVRSQLAPALARTAADEAEVARAAAAVALAHVAIAEMHAELHAWQPAPEHQRLLALAVEAAGQLREQTASGLSGLVRVLRQPTFRAPEGCVSGRLDIDVTLHLVPPPALAEIEREVARHEARHLAAKAAPSKLFWSIVAFAAGAWLLGGCSGDDDPGE
jgi:hypothetical protein